MWPDLCAEFGHHFSSKTNKCTRCDKSIGYVLDESFRGTTEVIRKYETQQKREGKASRTR